MQNAAENKSENQFVGAVRIVSFHNSENGYSVLKCSKDGQKSYTEDYTTVVGYCPQGITSGIEIRATGDWDTHPKFGKQFKAKSISEIVPTTKSSILRYLASGAVKGFGPVLAERLVEVFGDDTLRVIDEEPNKLLDIEGIGQKKLDEINEAWQEKSHQREVILFFQKYSLSHTLANKIFKEYKERTIEIVKSNPYLLARDIWGIGFKTADMIAISLGLEKNDPKRLIAGLKHVVKISSDQGHCFLPQEILLEQAASLLEVNDSDLLENALTSSLSQAELIAVKRNDSETEASKTRVDNLIYTPHIYKTEKLFTELAGKMIFKSSSPNASISPENLKHFQESKIELKSTSASPIIISLSEEQKAALSLVSKNTLSIITGGPGCGKTTVVRALTSMLKRSNIKLKLAAPTGRAAQRLAEVCNMEASTIHRLLKFDAFKKTFEYNSNDKLDLDALIIDESSMIDIQLAAALIQAVPDGARLIFVGDSDQLPSVGPGRVLADLLKLDDTAKVKLKTLFRRKEESSITHFAHQINNAEIPHIPAPDGKTKTDSYFIEASTKEKAASLIEKLVCDQIPKRFKEQLDLGSNDILVLTPMNKGTLGVIELNQRLQKRFIDTENQKAKVKSASLNFHLDDRVIQRVNNYNIDDAGVFNGDQGVISGIDAENKLVYVKLWDGRKIEYKAKELSQLDLAYALTIHRSQGSEVPVVVLALHESHNIMLERQLLYTAVTRAKKLLIIVGTKKALELSVKRLRSKARFTSLHENLTQLREEYYNKAIKIK